MKIVFDALVQESGVPVSLGVFEYTGRSQDVPRVGDAVGGSFLAALDSSGVDPDDLFEVETVVWHYGEPYEEITGDTVLPVDSVYVGIAAVR